MGQAYSLTTLSAGSAGIDVPELSDLTYEKSLGDARFMKSIRAKHRDGLVVAKVVMKPYASMKFNKYIKTILRERKLLNDIPNALGFHRAFETSSNGYLIRQYINNSIYDRMSTRPFLEDIEKRWLAFQLLSVIRDCHQSGVYHGDIKTENTLVTSWNWLYLADFSSCFKPTFLPEDNPAEFSFYFDISGRRTCYLAPERFLSHGESPQGKGGVTGAMDIFSVGCVIAELFLESPIFNLSQLFKYRQGEHDPVKTTLAKIEDPDVRELITHMIQIEPESRYSADEYLNFWRRRVFPEYFYSFLHQYMYLITDPSSGQSAITAGEANLGESDDRIDRVYFDFDKISFFLGYDESTQVLTNLNPFDQFFPLYLDVPNRREIASSRSAPPEDDGTLLFLNIITSSIRSTARSTSRVRACELLLVFAQRLTDESKLDRALPFVITLLNDPNEIVKVAALRTLTQLTALVSETSPGNAHLFSEYIIPRLENFVPLSSRKTTSLVRATYASCMATLAETASRFLDIVQASSVDMSTKSLFIDAVNGIFPTSPHTLYDVARAELVRFFETQTKALLTDSDSNVRRAFLGSVTSLCIFFGSAKTNDVVLSHLNTYLNDKDWRLKCAFFDTIVGVAVFVGSTSLEEFILPLMVQALTDPEESVVEKVLRSLATMAQLGLFQRSRTWELVDLVACFTMHPNIWIREATASFLSSCTKFISAADIECVMKPLLEPYLRVIPTTFTVTELLDALKPSLSRSVLDLAVVWVSKVDKGIFWKPVQTRSSLNLMEDRVQIVPSLDLGPSALAKVKRNEEDQQWLGRLRNAGMTAAEEFKLLALREYIWRMAQRKRREESESGSSQFNKIVNLNAKGIEVDTIFFDRRQHFFDEALPHEDNPSEANRPAQTITDALMDASATIDRTPQSRESSTSVGPAGRIPENLSNPTTKIKRDTSPNVSSPLSSSPTTHMDMQEAFATRAGGRNSSNLSAQPIQANSDNGSPVHTNGSAENPHNRSSHLKGNAIDLLPRKNSSIKASAETSTSSASAVGKNDALYGRDASRATPFALAQHEKLLNPTKIRYEAAHTYNGRDPNILKLLDTLYLDSYPIDAVEFGPIITPIDRRLHEKVPTDMPQSRWRPTRVVAATFSEHTGPVNRIVPSPDHLFFITASDDGTVRIWDSSRLEQSLSHRSRQMYRHSSTAKVLNVCFIETTHCFVSAADDGTVHVVKVDCTESSPGATKYGKLKLLRQWQLPFESSHVVWMEHFKAESQSVLIMATNTSKIIALDLKSMNVIFELQNPIHHGVPRCFCRGRKSHWLLLGTDHGVMDLWDLRFRLRLRSWALEAALPINRITLYPSQDQGKDIGSKESQQLVCVAGGSGTGEATIWNLEKATCVGVYRASDASMRNVAADAKGDKRQFSSTQYTLNRLVDSDTSEMLERFGTVSSDNQSIPKRNETIGGLAVGFLGNNVDGASKDPYMITAGPDTCVRFWDLQRIENSTIVNGTEADIEDQQDIIGTKFMRIDSPLLTPIYKAQVQYANDTRSPHFNKTGMTQASSARSKGEPKARPSASGKRTISSASTATIASEGGRSVLDNKNSENAPVPPTRTTVISEKQQKLLKSHLDSILDVAVLEYPCRMIISADRSGRILVCS